MKKIFSAIAFITIIFLAYIAIKPGDFMYSREVFIKASPDVIFPLINNAKKAYEWMPWKDSDPSVKIEYSGPEEGVGAKSIWNSTGKMGTGSSEVTESIVNKSVKTQLIYTKPMEMSQVAEVSLTAVDGGTNVKWSVSGINGFIFRIFATFVDCDKLIGGEFEKGLAKLKAQAEALNK